MAKLGKEYFDSIGYDPDALAKKNGLKSGDDIKRMKQISDAQKWMDSCTYNHRVYNVCGILMSILDDVKSQKSVYVIEKKIIIACGMAKKITQKLKEYKAHENKIQKNK